MMTPEQKFARWVRVSIAAFLGIFAWFIVADIWIPLTPDSTVMRVVTPVSSRVSGYVSHVYVHNNSQVKKGDLLYELDPTPFINKVEAAQIALEQAKLSNQQLDAQIAAARANLRTAQYTARNDKVTLDRYQRLSTMQNVSQSDLDKVRTTWQTSEQSVSALNAQIQNLLIQRGERDDKRNVTLQKYRNALEEAQLNLAWTKVRAETDGMVSNLQLNPGIYATAATAVLALVNNNTDIVADFREKSLRHTAVNTDAAVVFDALPGKSSRRMSPAAMPGFWRGRRRLTVSCRSRNSPPAGCATPSECAFTSRWISRWRNRCRPAPAPRCSCTIARDLSPAPSLACRSIW